MEKEMTKKEIEEKLKELKIEFLKQKGKRKDIKKGIARLLTSLTFQNKRDSNKKVTAKVLEKKK
jgi:ribosomal protein L29